MISYLVDGVLLLALITTSCVVGVMYRELRRENKYRATHHLLLSQTAETLAAIDQRIAEINTRGQGVLKDLTERVAEARLLLSDLDGSQTPPRTPERSGPRPGAAAHAIARASKH